MREDNFDLILPLWEEAKQLEKELPHRKREAFGRIKARFPGVRYGTFGALSVAYRAGRLDADVSAVVQKESELIDCLARRALWCRTESNRLGQLRRGGDERRVLDPSTDPIPGGPYPKLRDCSHFPLRQSCNSGENATSKWTRCEYMKYDRSKPNPWNCTALAAH